MKRLWFTLFAGLLLGCGKTQHRQNPTGLPPLPPAPKQSARPMTLRMLKPAALRLEFDGRGGLVSIYSGADPGKLGFFTNTTATTLDLITESSRFFRVREAEKAVTLAWDPVAFADPLEYRVQYGARSGAYTHSTSTTNTVIQIRGLSPGPTYFVVSARTAFGVEGPASDELLWIAPPLQWVPARIVTR